MRWLGGVAVFCAALVLSGCLSTSLPTTGLGDPALADVSFSCLAGLQWRPVEGVCSTTLLDPEYTRVEPYVAVHPDDADVWVVGFNANGPEVVPDEDEDEPVVDPLALLAPEPEPEGLPCGGPTLCFHLTKDAGASWRMFALPPVDGATATHDPVPLFAADGSLVVAGLFHKEEGNATVGRMAVLRSEDDGRTFSAPAFVVVEDGPDRPWLSRLDTGRLVLVWMSAFGGSYFEAAVSDDDGTTWHRVETPRCKWPGLALDEGAGRWSVVCSVLEPETSARLVTFAADGSVEANTDLGRFGAFWPFLMRGMDGRRLLVAERYGQEHVVVVGRSAGGWDEARAWAPHSRIIDGWAWSHVTAAEVAADGVVHVLVVGGEGERCANAFCGDSALNRQTALVLLDGAGRFVGERALTPADGAVRPDTDNDRGGPFQDDFHAAVRLGDRMLLAWSHDMRVEMAFVD